MYPREYVADKAVDGFEDWGSIEVETGHEGHNHG